LYFCVNIPGFFEKTVESVVYFNLVTETQLTLAVSSGLMTALDN